MTSSLVLCERSGTVATLILNQPERLNAVSYEMGEAFSSEVRKLGEDTELRAVVLTGAGRAFSAGGDMGMIAARATEGAEASAEQRKKQVREAMRAFYSLYLSLRDLPVPTVAAIQGHAIGAGLCVALACDLRVAARDAKLALNFVRLGVHPGMGATWTLPRLLPFPKAAELLYTAETISGERAAELGLVNSAVATEEVLPRAQQLAARIAANAPLAVRGLKRALAQSASMNLEEQLAFEASEQAECFASADIQEGLAALREKREPHFRGK